MIQAPGNETFTKDEEGNNLYENAGHSENPDSGYDTIFYTEDYVINIFYEGGH